MCEKDVRPSGLYYADFYITFSNEYLTVFRNI